MVRSAKSSDNGSPWDASSSSFQSSPNFQPPCSDTYQLAWASSTIGSTGISAAITGDTDTRAANAAPANSFFISLILSRAPPFDAIGENPLSSPRPSNFPVLPGSSNRLVGHSGGLG